MNPWKQAVCIGVSLSLLGQAVIPAVVMAAPRRYTKSKSTTAPPVSRWDIKSDCLTAMDQAIEDAKREKIGGETFGGGFAMGLLLGLLGTLLAPSMVKPDKNPPPRLIPPDVSGEWKACYMRGWETQTLKQKKGNATLGGLLGTAVWVVVGAIAITAVKNKANEL